MFIDKVKIIVEKCSAMRSGQVNNLEQNQLFLTTFSQKWRTPKQRRYIVYFGLYMHDLKTLEAYSNVVCIKSKRFQLLLNFRRRLSI